MTEEIKISNPSTWKYIKYIKEHEVVNINLFNISGALMYILTLIFYCLMSDSLDDSRVSNFSWILVGIHILVGILVTIDSIYYAGASVLLQTFIIGLGTFNTFSISSILGSNLLAKDNNDVFAYCVTSLGLACLSNAMMIALLFSIFHKKNQITN